MKVINNIIVTPFVILIGLIWGLVVGLIMFIYQPIEFVIDGLCYIWEGK